MKENNQPQNGVPATAARPLERTLPQPPATAVEVIEVQTERGYAGSIDPWEPAGGFAAGTNYLTDITIQSSNLDPNKETWTEYVNISTAEELTAFRNNVNNGTDNYAGKIVRLLNNITLTGAWTPIGTSSNKFQGTFDGRGYSIYDLNVNTTEDYVGLFGCIYNGTVRNLRVKGTVTTTGNYVGGIIGDLKGTTVENCIFSGEVNGRTYVGGIAGATGKSSSITGQIAGCHTKGKVTATNSAAGGIVGNSRNSAITHCYATGAISSGQQTGGIVGYNYRTTVTNCIALNPGITRTSGNYTNFGRIVGKDEGGSSVTSCFAFKDMTIKDVSNATITSGATSVAGDDLTAGECLTKTTYTDRGFKTDNNGWGFDNLNTPWTYLPWIRAFEFFSDITNADEYRIKVPQYITSTLIP